eukprot:TRINITY_DN14484_c0_g2_i1.p1 TRINITY_DN14484_c0_g2~~TRINITY_DN14484_c0_g2_i1.p1  ORF type:complete len:254 (-),score=-24.62 TRINITY_DN14484_c0_g2_i1:85-846(-)
MLAFRISNFALGNYVCHYICKIYCYQYSSLFSALKNEKLSKIVTTLIKQISKNGPNIKQPNFHFKNQIIHYLILNNSLLNFQCPNIHPLLSQHTCQNLVLIENVKNHLKNIILHSKLKYYKVCKRKVQIEKQSSEKYYSSKYYSSFCSSKFQQENCNLQQAIIAIIQINLSSFAFQSIQIQKCKNIFFITFYQMRKNINFSNLMIIQLRDKIIKISSQKILMKQKSMKDYLSQHKIQPTVISRKISYNNYQQL